MVLPLPHIHTVDFAAAWLADKMVIRLREWKLSWRIEEIQVDVGQGKWLRGKDLDLAIG